jgi:hypothetical protein
MHGINETNFLKILLETFIEYLLISQANCPICFLQTSDKQSMRACLIHHRHAVIYSVSHVFRLSTFAVTPCISPFKYQLRITWFFDLSAQTSVVSGTLEQFTVFFLKH